MKKTIFDKAFLGFVTLVAALFTWLTSSSYVLGGEVS